MKTTFFISNECSAALKAACLLSAAHRHGREARRSLCSSASKVCAEGVGRRRERKVSCVALPLVVTAARSLGALISMKNRAGRRPATEVGEVSSSAVAAAMGFEQDLSEEDEETTAMKARGEETRAVDARPRRWPSPWLAGP